MVRSLLPLLALLLLLGCSAHRSGDAVGAMSFTFDDGRNGLARFGRLPAQRALKNAMAHPQGRAQAFLVPGLVEPTWLNRETLDEDAYRLEIWYANQGFFDARFLGWELVARGGPGKKARRFDVRGRISEGEPSRIRGILSVGADRLGRPLRRRIGKLLGDASRSDIAPGEVFTYAAWEDTLGAIRRLLAKHSYAHARVEGDVAVYPDDRAVDVTVTIDPGPACVFGAVTIEGLVDVPEDLIREQVAVVPGRGYSVEALEATRAKLYALRVFGVVDVLPDLSDRTASVVPVRVRVTEAKFRELRAGPALAIDPGRASVAAQASYRDENLGKRLWRLEADVEAGAGVIADSVDALSADSFAGVRPIVDAGFSVELPRLFGSGLALKNEGRFELGLERGYRKIEPSFSPMLVWSGLRGVRPSFGYRIQYTEFLELTVDLEDIADSRLRVDTTNPYLLSMLEQRVVYEGRNDPLNTTRGWYWNAALAEAGGPLGGNYGFLRATGEVRAYRGIVDIDGWDPEVVFAGRLGGGVIVAYDPDEAAVPYAERLYLGGSNSVRGWGANRLGPYVCLDPVDDDAGVTQTCETTLDLQLPAGGELQLYGNFEVRKGGLPFGLVFAAFVDVGRVWDRPSRFDPGELQWSVGGGLRYPTPVGPIRIEVGFRLGEPEYFAQHRGYQIHLSLGEAF